MSWSVVTNSVFLQSNACSTLIACPEDTDLECLWCHQVCNLPGSHLIWTTRESACIFATLQKFWRTTKCVRDLLLRNVELSSPAGRRAARVGSNFSATAGPGEIPLMGRWACIHTLHTCNCDRRSPFVNNSERPVDALAEKHEWLIHNLKTRDASAS